MTQNIYYHQLNPVSFYSLTVYSKMIYNGKREKERRRDGGWVCVRQRVSLSFGVVWNSKVNKGFSLWTAQMEFFKLAYIS